MPELVPEPHRPEPGGLDLRQPEQVSAAELDKFREFYAATKGSMNRSYEFWLEFRPDVVKRHKARTVQWSYGEKDTTQILSMIHQYAIVGFADGVDYEIRLANKLGALRSDILDTLSIAFIHAGHPGMYPAGAAAAPLLRDYRAVQADRVRFPKEWTFDPDAFRSGMDFTGMECTPADLAALTAWYQEKIGEVPRHVTFLAKYRPDLLKAYRNRYEHAISESLPAQMMPYLQLHYNTYRGFDDGIRENLLLARAFGMTRTQVLNAVLSAVLHAGANALDIVDRVGEDLIESFPDT
ncbi:MAG TPA: hypothetical protein VHV74_19970 [Pseudonocardiaceae bacterium]|nr:hypothetical protein [Pseudonocardiaceae bacterium]